MIIENKTWNHPHPYTRKHLVFPARTARQRFCAPLQPKHIQGFVREQRALLWSELVRIRHELVLELGFESKGVGKLWERKAEQQIVPGS